MIDIKEKTAQVASVGADAELSSRNYNNNSITETKDEFNSSEDYFKKMQRDMLRMMDPSYLMVVFSLNAVKTDIN